MKIFLAFCLFFAGISAKIVPSPDQETKDSAETILDQTPLDTFGGNCTEFENKTISNSDNSTVSNSTKDFELKYADEIEESSGEGSGESSESTESIDKSAERSGEKDLSLDQCIQKCHFDQHSNSENYQYLSSNELLH